MIANNITKFIVFMTYSCFMISLFFIDPKSLHKIYTIAGISNDTITHLIAFFILALLTTYIFQSTHPMLLTFSVTFILAISIEMIQTLLPARHANRLDLLLHLSGSIGYILFHISIKKIKLIYAKGYY